MTQSGTPFATVEEYRRKSDEYFYQTNDGIHSLHRKGFDVMVLLLSKSFDHNLIQRALASFDSEGKVSMQFEGSKCVCVCVADPVRMAMYGYIESSLLTFLHLIDRINSLQAIIDGKIPKSLVEQNTQTDEISLNAMPINIGEMLNENL
ncbi:hypothetical protein PENTCL1PPCAC_19133, partial [Pristionchus entomophagus]